MTGEKDGIPESDVRTPEPVAVAFKERRTPLGRLVYREVEDLSDDDDPTEEPAICYQCFGDESSGEEEEEEEEDGEEAIRIAKAVAAAEVAAIQANAERRVVEAAVEAEVTGTEWTEKVAAEAAAEAEEAAIETEVVEVLKKVEARHRMPAIVQRPRPVRPSPDDITQFNLRPPTGGERVTFHCMTGWHGPAKE